jgi:hypothetical protein
MEENAIHAKYFELVRGLISAIFHIFRRMESSSQNSSAPNEIMRKRSRS